MITATIFQIYSPVTLPSQCLYSSRIALHQIHHLTLPTCRPHSHANHTNGDDEYQKPGGGSCRWLIADWIQNFC